MECNIRGSDIGIRIETNIEGEMRIQEGYGQETNRNIQNYQECHI